MIFEALYSSSLKNELILINGGYCRYHIRRDKQLTILEIISTRKGAGREMFNILVDIGKNKFLNSIFAKCPSDLESNNWYDKIGFIKEKEEKLPSGRKINLWRYRL